MVQVSRKSGSFATTNLRSLVFGGLMFLLLALLLALHPVLNKEKKAPTYDGEVIFCDAEDVDSSYFLTNGQRFYGGETQSDLHVFAGQYSSMLGGEQMYGLRYDLLAPQAGKRYRASVWAYRTAGDRGKLVASANDAAVLYKEEGFPVIRRDDGWEQLTLEFVVPEQAGDRIKVYVYVTQGGGRVFFDNFEIREVFQTGSRIDGEMPELLDISMSEEAYTKLATKKWKAVASGILITEDDDWVNASLADGENQIPVRTRLKGDWLDHLQGDKWSLRLKVKDPYAWNRMITFSIQSPETRYYLREYLFHKFLEREDVLTPRYEFVRGRLNGKDLGVYAVEEHFDKHLVEYQKRREGPILKLTEEAFWLGAKREGDYYGNETIWERMGDDYWRSEIRPFKENRHLADTTLSKHVETAQQLLYAVKYNARPVSEVFDVELLAKYHAIMDVNQAYHGLAWHNQRFYYNPVISKLEPIGFDGFGGAIPERDRPFLGHYVKVDGQHSEFTPFAFADSTFFRRYLFYLDQFTRQQYLDDVFIALDGALDRQEKLLQTEYATYRFDKEAIYKNARKIRHFLDPFDEVGLQARRDQQTSKVSVVNQHGLPLDIIGYGYAENRIQTAYNVPRYIPHSLRFQPPRYIPIEIPKRAKFIFFTLAGLDSVHVTPIVDWSAPSAPEFLADRIAGEKAEFILDVDGKWIVPEGSHQLSSDLIVPANRQLIMTAGTDLDLINRAKVIAYGPVSLTGNAEDPIRIFSSDQSSQGFSVLQAEGKSQLLHTHFENLNTIVSENWTLTGAVNFYESDVEIEASSITNNHCEDALNTIRSHVEIYSLAIANTFGDGYDADFCEGTIHTIRFRNTANDALDFSGSTLKIMHCDIDNANDKGISVGEESYVIVNRASIRNSNIGTASKDLSTLKIESITLENCKQGFAAYQKKPEFGPAEIVVENYDIDAVKQIYLIERGSKLTLRGRLIEGE